MTAVARRVLAALCGLLLLVFAAPAPARAGTPTTGVVTGDFRDFDGRPIPGAAVTLRQFSYPFPTYPAITDRAGRFRFPDLPPGTYDLLATTPGKGFSVGSSLFAVEAGAVEQVGVRLPGRHGAVAGRIVTDNGAPAGGAEVGVTVVGRETYRAVADARGYYFLDYVPLGTYRVVVRRSPAGAPEQWVPRASYLDATMMTVEAGKVLRVDERLLPVGAITGTFTGPDGPIAGSVDVVGYFGANIAVDGAYRVYVKPGDYRLKFENGFYRTQWAPGTGREAEAAVFHVEEDQVVRHDERLMADGRIGGRLLDYTGALVPGPVTVTVGGHNGSESTTTTDGSGYWSTVAFPDDYTVKFEYLNRRMSTVETYRVLPGQDTAVPDQALVQPGDAEIAVTVDGEPAQTFCVYLNVESAGAGGYRQCTENGTVLFEGMSPAGYYWNVTIDPKSWRGQFVTVAGGERTRATLAVTASAS